jgi:hypothetical protein
VSSSISHHPSNSSSSHHHPSNSSHRPTSIIYQCMCYFFE